MRRANDLNDFIFRIDHKYRPYLDCLIKTDNSLIYKAQDLNLQKDVCIKEVHIAGDRDYEVKRNLDKAMSEARTMVKVSGKTSAVPTIYLTYYDVIEKKLFIVMDWIEGKTFDKYIDSNEFKISEIEFLNWMEDLCVILVEMLGLKIYHKDIKPQNIIIDSNRKLNLMDFNISVSLPNKLEGTPLYKAPEMENSMSVTRDKVDVFSIGVIMYQYYTGKIPMRGSEYGQKSIRRNNADWDLFVQPKDLNRDLSETINSIINSCMQKDVNKRLGIRQLLYKIRSYKREVGKNGKKGHRPNKGRNFERKSEK